MYSQTKNRKKEERRTKKQKGHAKNENEKDMQKGTKGQEKENEKDMHNLCGKGQKCRFFVDFDCRGQHPADEWIGVLDCQPDTAPGAKRDQCEAASRGKDSSRLRSCRGVASCMTERTLAERESCLGQSPDCETPEDFAIGRYSAFDFFDTV